MGSFEVFTSKNSKNSVKTLFITGFSPKLDFNKFYVKYKIYLKLLVLIFFYSFNLYKMAMQFFLPYLRFISSLGFNSSNFLINLIPSTNFKSYIPYSFYLNYNILKYSILLTKLLNVRQRTINYMISLKPNNTFFTIFNFNSKILKFSSAGLLNVDTISTKIEDIYIRLLLNLTKPDNPSGYFNRSPNYLFNLIRILSKQFNKVNPSTLKSVFYKYFYYLYKYPNYTRRPYIYASRLFKKFSLSLPKFKRFLRISYRFIRLRLLVKSKN